MASQNSKNAQQGPKVYTVGIRKGGYAKTTTAVGLAVEWAQQGARVLLVDTDDNPSLTDLFMTDAQQQQDISPSLTAYRLFRDPAAGVAGLWWDIDLSYDARDAQGFRRYDPKLGEFAQRRGWRAGMGCLHIVPGHEDMRGIETELLKLQRKGVAPAGRYANPELVLCEALAPERVADYDIVLIDTPPADSLALRAALHRSDGVIVPLAFDRYGTRSYNRISMRTIEIAEERERAADHPRHGAPLAVAAVVPVMYRQGLRYHDLLMTKYGQDVGPDLVLPAIPLDPTVGEATLLNVPVQMYRPECPASTALFYAAKEIATRVQLPLRATA